jgi:DNA invertase Pin-like site-specific DNA recombinase
MTTTHTRVCLYARVSTHHQDHRNQMDELHRYAQRIGWQVVEEYVDYESGGKGREKRTNFDSLFTAAHQRQFDVLLFWALDRFSREGALKTLQYLELLTNYGIQYVSFTEPYLNSMGMFREAIVSIIATLAKQEKVRIGERVRAGLTRAKEKGKVGGRPTLNANVEKQILALKAEGLSNRAIGKRLTISHVSVGKYLLPKL